VSPETDGLKTFAEWVKIPVKLLIIAKFVVFRLRDAGGLL